MDLRDPGDEIATEVCVPPASGAPEVEVTYDGRNPPHELFARWADLGWSPPTPGMPPRDAIDWSTPDVEHGRRYTLRPFRAVGRATLARRDASPTIAIEAALDAARALGYQVEGGGGALVDLTSGGARHTSDLVHLTTSQPTHAAAQLEALARSRGGQVASREVIATREVSYRGSTNTVSSLVIEMEIVIDRAELAALHDAADTYGVTPAVITDGCERSSS
jgi:hypothetical protein